MNNKPAVQMPNTGPAAQEPEVQPAVLNTDNTESAANQTSSLDLGFQTLSAAAMFKLHNRATPEQYVSMLVQMAPRDQQEARKQVLIWAINEWSKYIIKCIREYKVRED